MPRDSSVRVADPRTPGRAAESGVPWAGAPPVSAAPSSAPPIRKPAKTPIPKPPTEQEEERWQKEARQKGLDPIGYVQRQWMKARGITVTQLAELGQVLPGTTTAKGDLVIPVGAKTGPLTAAGTPEYYTHRGVNYYAPGSTMYERGFRTDREYEYAQRYDTLYGPHSGKDIPKGSIVITDRKGKAILRIPPKQLRQALAGSRGGSIIRGFLNNKQYKVPIIGARGTEKLLTPNQALKLAGTETPQEQFKLMVKMGVIPAGSELISSSKDGLKYQLPKKAQPKTAKSEEKTTTKKITSEWVHFIMEPDKAKVVTSKKLKTPRKVWQSITPWRESQGETFISFFKDVSGRFTKKPTQQELKVKYEKEKDSPLWAKLLFGPEVIKDEKTGNYIPIYYSDPPAVGPAKRLPAKTVRQITKSIEVNWNKFLTPKEAGRTPVTKADWEKILTAIKGGKIKGRSSPTVEKLADDFEKAHFFEMPTIKPAKVLKPQTFKEGIKAARKAYSHRPENWNLAARILTKTKFQKVIGESKYMRPDRALIHAIKNGVFTVAIATNPVEMSQLLSKVSAKQKAAALTELDPATKRAIEQNNFTQAQASAITELNRQAKMSEMTKEAIETATQLALQQKTETQIKTALKNQLREQAQQQTQLKAKLQAQVVPMTILATQTATSIKTPRTSLSRLEPREPLRPLKPVSKIPPPGFKLRQRRDGKEAWSQEQIESAQAWKQGFGYWAVKSPYASKEDTQYFLKPPRGMTVHPSARKAMETIQTLTGKPPAKLRLDMGIMDITLERGQRISFQRDIKQRTAGDIALGSNAPLNRNRIYAKGNMLSRRRIGKAKHGRIL